MCLRTRIPTLSSTSPRIWRRELLLVFLFLFLFSFLLFWFCCDFLLTCRYNVFTEIWYPNTPKFYNPISNTDSSFTNSHKLKSHAHPTHTQNSSQLVSIAHTYTHTQTPHNEYRLTSKTLGPNHPTTRNLQSRSKSSNNLDREIQIRSQLIHTENSASHNITQTHSGPPRHPRRLTKAASSRLWSPHIHQAPITTRLTHWSA
jgi:hypothetical protein